MADFPTAYNWMMDNEDASRAYADVPDAPPGAHAISGINSAAWPEEFEAIAALSQDQREPLVQQFYENHFWNMWYAQLTSDEVAKRVFDMAVNAGSVAAVRCLQEAMKSLVRSFPLLVTDGLWGPNTIQQVNLVKSDSIIPAFQQARVTHYDALIAANPALAIYKDTWTARAEK